MMRTTKILIFSICLLLIIQLFSISSVNANSDILIDSYISPYNQDRVVRDYHPSASYFSACGVALNISDNYFLTKISFYCYKTGSPTGTAYIKVYGVTPSEPPWQPNATLYTTSNPIDVSTLPTSINWVNFTFDGTFILQKNSGYCFAFENPSSGNIDVDNCPIFGHDNLDGDTDANSFTYRNGWSHTSHDMLFRLYGVAYEVGWKQVETWSGTITGKTFYLIETWFGTLQCIAWNFVEAWISEHVIIAEMLIALPFTAISLICGFMSIPMLVLSGKKKNKWLFFMGIGCLMLCIILFLIIASLEIGTFI